MTHPRILNMLEKETKDRLINDMLEVAPAISSDVVANVLPLLIILDCALYVRLTQLPKYDPNQQKRHTKLVNEYQSLCITCNPANPHIIPRGWRLDEESRPLHDFDLKKKGSELSLKFRELDIRPTSIHLSACGMLSAIVKLFDSISNRKREKLQAGCLEGMFFSELANWIVIELPTLKFDTKKDLAKLKARRKYCHEILIQVLTPDKIGKRNNPMDTLKEIMVSLDAIIEATEDLIQFTTFHDLGARFDDAVLGMAAQTFQVMRLMINGDSANEMDLPVHLFLDDTQTYRPKINELKQKRLGQWLQATLMKIDIRSNDFVAHKSISLEEAAKHLHGECIDDTPCTLPSKLTKDPNHSDWGHWDFMLTNRDGSSRNIKTITKNIQHIYRDVLNLYYVRDLLSKLCKTSPVYGEVWLYKDTTGKAMLSVLLNIADKMITQLNQSFNSFFKTTIDLFDAKVMEVQIKQKDDCYSAIAAARDQYTQFITYNTTAADQIHRIKKAIGTFDSRIAKADETKYLLLKAIVDFIEYHFEKHGSEYPKEYEVLKKALKEASILRREVAPPFTTKTTPTETHYKTLRELRIKDARYSEVTKLDLSACGLSALDKKDRNELCQQLTSFPTSIVEVDLSNNALYDIKNDDEEDKKFATATLIQIVRQLPNSATTLYLAGNGVEYYNHAQLSELFSGFPEHILTVSLRDEKPLELSQQLARLEWPRSYYDMARGKQDFMDIAKVLLMDYAKSTDFELIITCHWNRHLAGAIRDILGKMEPGGEFDTGEKLFKELDVINKDNKYHGGSLSRRYTFLFHCYSGNTPSLESRRSHSTVTKENIELSTITRRT